MFCSSGAPLTLPSLAVVITTLLCVAVALLLIVIVATVFPLLHVNTVEVALRGAPAHDVFLTSVKLGNTAEIGRAVLELQRQRDQVAAAAVSGEGEVAANRSVRRKGALVAVSRCEQVTLGCARPTRPPWGK